MELSSIDLQEASWCNPARPWNPHYTFLEFVVSSRLAGAASLEFHLREGVITPAELDALLPLSLALSEYSPPQSDWHNDESVLQDPAWRHVVEVAEQSLEAFLAITFNAAYAEP